MPRFNPELRAEEYKYETSPRQEEDLGLVAEDVVMDFLDSNFKDVMRVRHATEDEDRGGAGQKQIIDAVVYKKERETAVPLLGIQITTVTDRVDRQKKIEEIKKLPWIHLPEMRIGKFIPRILVFIKARDVATVHNNPDFNAHPDIAISILDSALASLRYLYATTRYEKHQAELNNLLDLFEQKKRAFEEIKRGKPIQ